MGRTRETLLLRPLLPSACLNYAGWSFSCWVFSFRALEISGKAPRIPHRFLEVRTLFQLCPVMYFIQLICVLIFFLARKRARETGRRTETTGNSPNQFYFCYLLHE